MMQKGGSPWRLLLACPARVQRSPSHLVDREWSPLYRRASATENCHSIHQAYFAFFLDISHSYLTYLTYLTYYSSPSAYNNIASLSTPVALHTVQYSALAISAVTPPRSAELHP